MRPLNHLTPRYIFNRIKFEVYQRLHPEEPWLTAESIHLLKHMLSPHDTMIEFGSGRSTQWFARNIKHLTSIEGHQAWYEKVKQTLAEKNLNNVDYKFLDQTSSTLTKDYETLIRAFKKDQFTVALVDGQERDTCAWEIIPKLASGGLLVIDNANWYLPRENKHIPSSTSPASCHNVEDIQSPTWQKFYKKTETWRRIWTSNGVTDTLILFKP